VELSTGRNGNIHETLLAMSKADVSFRMLTEVRNKIVSAYQEVMRMQA
jgi:flagellar hook-basal body complex protein FliE